MVTCPTCKGRKKIPASIFVNEDEEVPCQDCEGKGEVTEEKTTELEERSKRIKKQASSSVGEDEVAGGEW